jgi:hypothetical protein
MHRLLVSLLTLSLLAGCAHTAAPQSSAPAASAPKATAEARKLAGEADALVMQGKPAEALPLYLRAWEQGVRKEGPLYNAACAAALAGGRAEALTWLERAVEAGFADAQHLRKDSDLESLREEPAFARLVERAAANEAKRNMAQNPGLRDELLRMLEEDQAARREAIQTNFKDAAVQERMRTIDQRNTARMKEIIAQAGWPTRTLVGQRGAKAAWLLVQHADLDPAFQKECLVLLEKAVAAGEAAGEDLAYLTDRVLVAEGKPQRYGTQFHMVDGQLVPRPLEDEAQVDARREAVGLGTMAEYAAQMRQLAAPSGK